MIRTTTLLIIFGMISSLAEAQTWKPSPSAFSITYPQFEDPEAVVFYEVASAFAGREAMNIEEELRIHILKESGKDQGEVEVFHSKEDFIRIREAWCFNLEENGTVSASPVPPGNIFRNPVNENYSSFKFSFPDVRVGSIITYSLERVQKRMEYFTWHFQADIPKTTSKVSFRADPTLGYTFVFLGTMEEKLSIKDGTIYSMTDIPGQKVEPFVPDEEIYEPKVRFQLTEYLNQSTNRVDKFLSDWEEFGKTYLRQDHIGKLRKKDEEELELRVAKICQGMTDPEEKARAIFNWVRDRSVWSGRYRITPEESPADVITNQGGSSAEINYLLLHMLKIAGIDVQPAIVGTIGHSVVIEDFPIISQFNTTLVYCKVGEKTFALDATDPYRPFELPASAQLNEKMLIVEEKNVRWEGIPINQISKKTTYGILTLTADGAATGNMKLTLSGYHAVKARSIIKKEGLDAFVSWRMDEGFPLSGIISSSVTGVSDPDSVITLSLKLSIPELAMVTGDFLYLQPVLIDKITENPFKDAERIYPIDFVFPTHSSYRMSYALPQGYTFDDGPSNTQVKLDEKAIAFTYLASDNVISYEVTNDFQINGTNYHPDSQADIKTIYDRIISRHGQQLVLKKNTP